MALIAAIPCDLEQSRFGLPSRLGDRLGERTVLGHTVMRAAQVPQVTHVVLICPAGQDPRPLLEGLSPEKPISVFTDPDRLADRMTPAILAARKWAMTAWRGGLGQATAWDEALPPGAVAAAAADHGADSVLLIRGDWCLVDPGFAAEQIKAHLLSPEQMKLVFTQAPPGLSGIVVWRRTLEEMADAGGTFGRILGYNPQQPVIDPIGRDVNVPIPAEVRDCGRRFIYDTPRSIDHLKQIAHRLGPRFEEADAQAIVAASQAVVSDSDPLHRLPQVVTVELTPRRPANGPVTPQHHVSLDREDLTLDLARRIFDQLEPDTALLLGGLGDVLEHPQWETIVAAAREAGLLGVAITTDLLGPADAIHRLMEADLDLISVRLSADTAQTYRQVMGVDRFGEAAHNLEQLLTLRNERGVHRPWIVPHLVKVRENLKDMESFFERWTRIGGHAVIEPMLTGCGLAPDLSPVPMTPPRRTPCRQLGHRMTILSDGTVALCDQDWLGRAAPGNAADQPLLEIWRRLADPLDAHAQGRAHMHPLCAACDAWHRP